VFRFHAVVASLVQGWGSLRQPFVLKHSIDDSQIYEPGDDRFPVRGFSSFRSRPSSRGCTDIVHAFSRAQNLSTLGSNLIALLRCPERADVIAVQRHTTPGVRAS